VTGTFCCLHHLSLFVLSLDAYHNNLPTAQPVMSDSHNQSVDNVLLTRAASIHSTRSREDAAPREIHSLRR
jgi:hypothetical protein